MRILRQAFLVALGVLILLAAHPVGSLAPASHLAWNAIAPWGIDVAMQPLTVDMTLMLEKDRGGATYQRKPTLWLLRTQGWEELPWKRASLYGVRVPLLLLSDQLVHGAPVGAHVRGVCYQLRRMLSDTKAFRVNLDPERPLDRASGFGREWSCGESLS